MITFLINCSVVWVVGVVCFDLFLKRNTHHGWNRVYLLKTLIAGLIAPFIKWTPATIATNSFGSSLQYQTQNSRQALANAIAPAPAIHWSQILSWVYIIGLCFALLFLLREIYTIISYYRSGRKTKDGRWTIIETNRQHGPFSIFHFIFISAANSWEPEEYQIVLNHEKAHSRHWHAIDLCLLQLLQLVFWFHPLLYLYRRRLVMVHEYQADASVAIPPKQYGNFLLAQFMLQQTPSFSHSFYHSPIKKRVLMITQSASSKLSRAKYLLLAPLLMVTVVCCSKSQYSGERKKEGNKITYKGNVFEMSKSEYDTIQMINPTSGQTNVTVIEKLPYPQKMNGNPILRDDELTQAPVYKGASATPGEDLFAFIKSDLEKLPDGEYTIIVNNPVVDAQGGLVYFEEDFSKKGVTYTVQDVGNQPTLSTNQRDVTNAGPVAQSQKETIEKRIDFYLGNESLKFAPGQQHGKAVASYHSSLFGYIGVTVKNHQATMFRP